MQNNDWKLYSIHDDKQIAGFFGDYRFLSNFHLCPVMYEGVIYPSSESAYQAAKIVANERDEFVRATPAMSKKLWKEKRFTKLYSPEKWDEIKLDVMYQINLDKYSRNVDLLLLLLGTGDRLLEETNSWRDVFWGCDTSHQGENNLGKILMNIRQQLRRTSAGALEKPVESTPLSKEVAGSCSVVNMRLGPFDAYIGRGSIFGNPFEIGKDGTRDQVIDRYSTWFNHLLKDKVFQSALSSLKGKKLGCFCKQADREVRCHGDIIAAYVNRAEF